MQYVQHRFGDLSPDTVTTDTDGLEVVNVTITPVNWLLWALLAGLFLATI